MEKIDYSLLDEYNKLNASQYFGNWINDIDELNNKFVNNKPFKHIIIENFLNDELAEKISNEFPLDFDNNWHKYYNPLEVKYAKDNINDLSNDIKKVFYLLSTDEITNKIAQLSGIYNLNVDPYLHGAGLHAHPRYGRLNLHLDYEKHPYSGKQRRLNVILYLSKNWQSEWNGATELWNDTVTECCVKSPVVFNSAVIFQTNEISYHGLPEKILCPEGVYRKSLAYYYVSPLESNPDISKFGSNLNGYRLKASFVNRPSDSIEFKEKINKLNDIRPHRLITNNDMNEHWPEWTPELF